MAPRTRHEYARERAAFHNSRGFSAFPTELLHQVASHIEGTTTIPWYQDRPLDGQRNKRRDVLRALCQLCRSLRTAILPLVWQTLEAYTLTPPPSDAALIDSDAHAARVKGVGKELLGQLRLVRNVKQPYASHVRIITAAVYSMDALTKLARAMMLMPNLHTIHIMCDGYGCGIRDYQFQKAFSGLVFPSVRRVILPVTAQAIIGTFPEVVEVVVNHHSSQAFHLSKFLDKMVSHCPKVESIGWRVFFPPSPDSSGEDSEESEQVKRNTCCVVERLPNLRRIAFYLMDYDVDEIMQLLPLNLEKITLVSSGGYDSEEMGEMVEAAQQVLARSSLPNKCLEVMVRDEKRMIDIPDKA